MLRNQIARLDRKEFLKGKPDPRTHRFVCQWLDSVRAEETAGRRLDAGETMLLARQIEFVQAEVLTVDFPELKARRLIPLASGVPEGAQVYTYRKRTAAGRAAWIANMADDVNVVSAKYEEASQLIRTLGVGYDHSITELLAAAMAGIPLASDKATDAREAAERFIDEIAAFGDTSVGVNGWLKSDDSQGVLLQTKAGDGYTGTFGGAATGATMLADMQKFAQSLWLNSKGVYTAERIVVDDASYSNLVTTPYSATIPDTVLEVFLRSNPGVREVIPWNKCALADADSNGPRWVAYTPRPDAMKLLAPAGFRFLPPQASGLMMHVPGFGTCGGVLITKPMAMTYLDGMRD